METSAPKRRRTSPRTSVPIDNRSDPEPTTGPASGAKRPSFASPTKASLAKHNPDILQRRRQDAKTAQSEVLSASRPTTRDGEENIDSMLDRQLRGNNATGSELQENIPTKPNQKDVGSERGGLRKFGGAMAAQAKRTPTRTKPRPLPAPGPDEDDAIPNPFLGRALRRSGVGVGLFPAEDPEEPELPPTPEHPDPEVSTPPSGIHNTPSKRALKRARSFGKSSPLKKLPMRPSRPSKTDPSSEAGGEEAPGTEVRLSLRRGGNPRDPDAEKTALRDSLLAEIAGLEADLELVSGENKRIQEARAAGKNPGYPGRPTDIQAALGRHLLPPEDKKPDAEARWLQSALDPMSFLPFGKLGSSLPSLFDTEAEKDSEDGDEEIKSHYPVPMDAEEELPFLQAFSPLSFSSQISLIPRDSPSEPLLQKHTITATSADTEGLFHAVIEMAVNAKTFTITDLRVPRLEPAAREELDPFINRIVGQDANNSILRHNANLLSFAMGEWLRESTKRARFWHTLDRKMGSKRGIAKAVVRARAKKKNGKRRQNEPSEEDNEDGIDGIEEWSSIDPDRSDILPHMGRTAMDLPVLVDGTENWGHGLRVKWRIEFEGSGEAHSRISVLSGMSPKCHLVDEHRSFSKLSRLFDNMLQGGEEPVAAVETVVALMVGEAAG